MMIKPIGRPDPKPPIIFKGEKECQPIKPQASQPLSEDRKLDAADFVTITKVDGNGNKVELKMTPEEYKQYQTEEASVKHQEWLALIKRPGNYTVVQVTENNKNKGFQ